LGMGCKERCGGEGKEVRRDGGGERGGGGRRREKRTAGGEERRAARGINGRRGGGEGGGGRYKKVSYGWGNDEGGRKCVKKNRMWEKRGKLGSKGREREC